jgi:hypothetical protein
MWSAGVYGESPTFHPAVGAIAPVSPGMRLAFQRTGSAVPEISRFHGIVISMYHREHGRPHFHVRHAGRKATVEIQTGAQQGALAPTAQRSVLEWLSRHRQELLDNWTLAQARSAIRPIDPLE